MKKNKCIWGNLDQLMLVLFNCIIVMFNFIIDGGDDIIKSI